MPSPKSGCTKPAASPTSNTLPVTSTIGSVPVQYGIGCAQILMSVPSKSVDNPADVSCVFIAFRRVTATVFSPAGVGFLGVSIPAPTDKIPSLGKIHA